LTKEALKLAQEQVSFPCCGYTDAIKWNQGVVQCHMCGQVYTVAQPAQRQWVGLTEEDTKGFTSHEMTVVKYVSKVLQEKNT
jgi:hypothetical protein